MPTKGGWKVIEQVTLSYRDRRVARVLEFVKRDLTRRVSRAEAARAVCLEPAYFSKRFQKAVGIPFSTWSARIRIEVARSLLRSSDYRISEVAASVGYQDVTTFERNFRKHAGVSPRLYRALAPSNGATEERLKTPKVKHGTPIARSATLVSLIQR